MQTGRGFMSGQEKRQALIAQLLIAHAGAAALFILRVQQHGKQVTTILGPLSALGDDAVYDLIDACTGPVQFTHG